MWYRTFSTESINLLKKPKIEIIRVFGGVRGTLIHILQMFSSANPTSLFFMRSITFNISEALIESHKAPTTGIEPQNITLLFST